MMIGQGISLDGMTHNDFHYPFHLATTMVAADVGKPVAIDATAANTVKVAGDDDEIIGKLVTFEDRTIEGIKVGTVALRGGFRFPVLASDPLKAGDTAVGAGNGDVKAAATANHASNIVVEVANGFATIVR